MSLGKQPYGPMLQAELDAGNQVALMGVYDCMSATLAAKHWGALFLSGFGFSASQYGLPDIGFIAWPDIVAWTQRVRTILPKHHLVVDIDDGYCDTEVAKHVVALLHNAGASAVVIEDQKRPRRCGHLPGKLLLEKDAYITKLKAVLEVKGSMLVIARTDATDIADIEERVMAMHEAGADAILVDGVKDLSVVANLKRKLPQAYFMFNQIAGGVSPSCTLTELNDIGVKLVNFSTPCLFAAQKAINDAMIALKAADGRVDRPGGIGVPECNALLGENVLRRDGRSPDGDGGDAVEANGDK